MEQIYLQLISELESYREKNRTLQEQLDETRLAGNSEESEIYEQQFEISLKKLNSFTKMAVGYLGREGAQATVPMAYNEKRLSDLALGMRTSMDGRAYAEKLYTEANAQRMYLAKERENRLAAGTNDAEEQRLKEAIKENEHKIRETLSGDKAKQLYALLDGYNHNIEVAEDNKVCVGFTMMKYPLFGLDCEQLGIPADIYDRGEQALKVPAFVSIDRPFVFFYSYQKNEQDVLSNLQNIIRDIHRNDKDCLFTVIDPIRYSSSGFHYLERIIEQDNTVIDKMPKSEEEVQNTFVRIINSCNSGRKGSELPRRVIICHDYPDSYSFDTIGYIRRICSNSEYYNTSVILTHCVRPEAERPANPIFDIKPFFTYEVAISEEGPIWSLNNKGGGRYTPRVSGFYVDGEEEESYKSVTEQGLYEYFAYFESKADKSLHKGEREIPDVNYGVSDSGEICRLNFERNNFSTFICGSSRVGKSTLLHVILTELFNKMHPDDIEIWLIDFKMTEFSRYIKHLAPHIRYLILDESPELVYDIIDKLTDILEKRQAAFMGKWQKLYEIPPEKYMPAMFIIIDEFSVMSNIISDAAEYGKGDYTIKMQTLLAKGAALGMHFIFSSQGFTSGSRGLNDFSKKQIQQRIAMKTDYDEIVSTLDIRSRSESDKYKMENLAPYFSLVREKPDEQGNYLKLAQNFYINDYSVQEAMIDEMIAYYRKSNRYEANDDSAYVYKHSVVVDGSRFEAFSEQSDRFDDYIAQNDDGFKTVHLFVGSPKRLAPMYPVELYREFADNIMLVSPGGNALCTASSLLAIRKSMQMQGGEMVFMAGSRSLLAGTLSETTPSIKIVREYDDITSKIHEYKMRIEDGIEDNVVIALLDFANVIMEMKVRGVNKLVTAQEESEPEEDKSFEVGENAISYEEFLSDPNAMDLESQLETGIFKTVVLDFSNGQKNKTGIDYEGADPIEELDYILKNGPRYGYHLLLHCNGYAEWSQMRFNADLFKHKILAGISKDDASMLAGAKEARTIISLQENLFRYTNGVGGTTYKPYTFAGISFSNTTDDGGLNDIDDYFD